MQTEDMTDSDRMVDTARRLNQRFASSEQLRMLDETRAYPFDIHRAWVDAGFFALALPEAYGGLGGSISDLVALSEELARPSNDLSMAFGGPVFCSLNLARKGSEEQKRHWLPKLASGKIRMSISMSEPDAGSDVGAIRTAAVRDGDAWVLDGTKIWATAAGVPDTVINMYVRTDPAAHYSNGLSLFLVPNDLPGLTIRKLDMLGRRSVGTYEITLDNVRVPHANLVGGENRGWDCVKSGLQVERTVAAACDCGTARGVAEIAIAYARERRQFGRPIGSNQAIAHMLADVVTAREAAWALTCAAARTLDHGGDALKEITMAKLLASEAYQKATEVGMQVMGANGYAMDYEMQRHFRDARAATIAAGSSQIQRNLIAGLIGLKIQ